MGINWPKACVGCGNTNSDELKEYSDTATAEHTQHFGTTKRTTKYSINYTPYLCSNCKGEGRLKLLRGWVIQLIFGILILYALFIYPITSGHWWLFEIAGSNNLWAAILGYLFGSLLGIGLVFAQLIEAFTSPYRHFLKVQLKASAYGATPKVIMKSNQFAQIFVSQNHSVDAEYQP